MSECGRNKDKALINYLIKGGFRKMILKEQLWLMEEFFIGQFGEQESAGKGARTRSKAKNNPQAGFSAQEN